ncbi:MAG: acyl-CoA reductase [Flavobacteriales bacterium]|nr:acyl-CoA reductase [Flavobacteriales bacterium]
MNFKERINAFSELGNYFSNGLDDEFTEKIREAEIKNPWFTTENQKQAIYVWGEQLTNENLDAWLSPYHLSENKKPKNVLIIMAGNIPLVGFHDFLSVLISGDNAVIKMSVNDNILLPFIIKKLIEINPEFEKKIQFVEEIKNKKFDVVIATGSDMSAKYFDYYFKNAKKIIRKNRKSVAILDGTESKEELGLLAKDVFSYFGLGCRNVSKIFLPKGYDLDQLFEVFYPYQEVIEHKKYSNNYDYNKAVYLMGNYEITENGFLLLKEDSSLQSPLAMLHYEFYSNIEKVESFIAKNKQQLQCIVSKDHIAFGQTQKPNLWDYADGEDTIEFLREEE